MKTQDVKLYAAQQLHRLQALPDNQRRAELAKLRRGIGHAPGELPELWGSFLLGMPESFQGRSAPSAAEWAVYLALTLYAMHQQGNDRLMNCPGNTLGRAVRQLAERNSAGQDWTEASVLRRFNALATAEEITEISHHLRGMIQLLSAARMAASRWIIRSLRQTCMNCNAPTRDMRRPPPMSVCGGDRTCTATRSLHRMRKKRRIDHE